MNLSTRSKWLVFILFLVMMLFGHGHNLFQGGGIWETIGAKDIKYGLNPDGTLTYIKFYQFFWLLGLRVNFVIDAILLIFLLINRKKINYAFLLFFIAIGFMRVFDVLQLLSYGDQGVWVGVEIVFNILGFLFLIMSFNIIKVGKLNRSINKETTDVILFSLPFSKLFKRWFGKDKVKTEEEMLEELYSAKDALQKVADTRNVEDQTLMSSITFLIDDLAEETHPDKREELKQKYYDLLSQYMVNGQKIEDLLARATKK